MHFNRLRYVCHAGVPLIPKIVEILGGSVVACGITVEAGLIFQKKKLGEKAVKIIIINVCCDDDKDKTRAVVQKIYSC